MNLYKILVFTVLIGILSGLTFAQAPRKSPKTIRTTAKGASNYPVPNRVVFLGEIIGNAYQNKYFGMRIIPPETWLAQGSKVNTAIKTTGSGLVSGKTKTSDKALDEAVNRMTVLFTTSKDILGIQNNAVLFLTVEKTPPLIQVRNGLDYLRLTVQSFKVLTLPPDFKYSSSILSEKFGKETFYYMDIERAGFSQRLYATARKGYALFFTLVYFSNEDLNTMKEILRKSDFAWKG